MLYDHYEIRIDRFFPDGLAVGSSVPTSGLYPDGGAARRAAVPGFHSPQNQGCKMLDVFKLICVWFGRLTVGVCAAGLTTPCFAETATPFVPYIHFEDIEPEDEDPLEALVQQAEALAKKTDIHEIVRIIVQFRCDLVAQGCAIPPLTHILADVRDYLGSEGLTIDDEVFDRLYTLFAQYENPYGCTGTARGFEVNLIKHKPHKKKKKEKEIHVSSKTAMGFLKFMGGALLCLVPIPIVQGAGASLAVIGVNDMVNAARDREKSEPESHLEESARIERQLEAKPAG